MSVERMKVAIRKEGKKSGGNRTKEHSATVLPRQLLCLFFIPKITSGLPHPRSVRSTADLKKFECLAQNLWVELGANPRGSLGKFEFIPI
jgi:hypothetical protein